MILRAQYNYDAEEASNEAALLCLDASKTQQHEKEDADINTIVKRFNLTGQLPENVRVPQYGDFTGITDYQTALNTVKAAEDAFMMMPWDVRRRFNNDPAQFVDFCSNPENQGEAVKLGLAIPIETKEPEKTATDEGKAASQAAPAPVATPPQAAQ